MSEKKKIWYCKVGEVEPERVVNVSTHTGRRGDSKNPDEYMRAAISRAYLSVTGLRPDFIFSGWGAELEERERAVVEDRMPVPDALGLIEVERWAQAQRGYTADHDDQHIHGELVQAAICYAENFPLHPVASPPRWPWARTHWNPSEERVRNLTKAGALIAAEIDRLLREERGREPGS